MRIENYGGAGYSLVVYSIFSGRVYLDVEHNTNNPPGFSILLQLGGDHLFYKSLSLFGRSITFGILPDCD